MGSHGSTGGSTAGRGDVGGGGNGGGGGGADGNGREGGDKGRPSDLRQVPSQILVQDVYPPELSRYQRFLCGSHTVCNVGNVKFNSMGSTFDRINHPFSVQDTLGESVEAGTNVGLVRHHCVGLQRRSRHQSMDPRVSFQDIHVSRDV